METKSDLETSASEANQGKNIILFADGTGNRGGYSPESNVYSLYQAIDIHDPDLPQLIFYDNGVGTSKNKYLRALGAAVGIGFTENVLDLYISLARVYEPGDHVYLFGFSRGAATVRALAGFFAHAGLVDGRELDEDELRDAVDEALTVYRKRGRKPPELPEPHVDEAGAPNHGAIEVHLIGVWDTVSALGFPQNWNILGVGFLIFNYLFKILGRVSDVFFPHRFWDYELNPRVRHAYHALALDDERQSFLPMIWDENRSPDTEVEQVWFAGAHSNVGGGYGRDGLSDLALRWMMLRAQNAGGHELLYRDGALEDLRGDENQHGRLYNSRDGFAIYYRYHPREVDRLSEGLLRDRPRVHSSVFSRMKYRTANYTTGHLPHEFEITESEADAEPVACRAAEEEGTWQRLRQRVRRPEFVRKFLYMLFLEFSLGVLIAALYFWRNPPDGDLAFAGRQGAVWSSARWILDKIAAFLDWLTPAMLEGLVDFAVRLHPQYLLAALLFLLALRTIRSVAWNRGRRAREEMRRVVLEQVKPRRSDHRSA